MGNVLVVYAVLEGLLALGCGAVCVWEVVRYGDLLVDWLGKAFWFGNLVLVASLPLALLFDVHVEIGLR